MVAEHFGEPVLALCPVQEECLADVYLQSGIASPIFGWCAFASDKSKHHIVLEKEGSERVKTHHLFDIFLPFEVDWILA